MATPDQLTEEQRAADYQASCAARNAFISARAVALAPTMGSDVADGWRPLLEALTEPPGVCDIIGDSAQLAQLTSGGPTMVPSPVVERLRERVGDPGSP